MLDHSRHRGEPATKTVKFFVAHTVNCVLCNIHTIIDWMLLNFTLVIQQNCQPSGPKVWEIILRSWQVELSTWAVKIRNQPIQKRSCFWYRKLYACNLLTWGLNVVLGYLTSSDFCVAKILWASNVPESSRCWQHRSKLITRLRPDCFTFCNTCHVIGLYWYFKNCQLNMYCECYNIQ